MRHQNIAKSLVGVVLLEELQDIAVVVVHKVLLGVVHAPAVAQAQQKLDEAVPVDDEDERRWQPRPRSVLLI